MERSSTLLDCLEDQRWRGWLLWYGEALLASRAPAAPSYESGKAGLDEERGIAREIRVGEQEVSSLLLKPAAARSLLVLGHGAGAGMRHPFMASIGARLAEVGVATLRYQFPYMETGSRRPDPKPLLLATVRAAVREAARRARGLPLLAGGKSMGGRMASSAAAEAPLPEVRGLVFFGFPLHPAGRPSVERAAHLDAVRLPMLFLQGDHDRLADLELLRPVCMRLGERATLHVVPGADHGFHVLKASGRTDDEVRGELARVVASWAEALF
jgi:predicted alpha/beta-hydrolase family hydrolase